MKKKGFLLFVFLYFAFNLFAQNTSVHTTYLWHMDQPIYWGEKSQINPNITQAAKESQDIKMAGGNKYPGNAVSHPENNLEEIFGKPDRVNAYQTAPGNAINSIKGFGNAGAQLSISGGLLRNCNSLGQANQWGYSPTWNKGYTDARALKTAAGNTRLDIIAFTNNHALSPLISYRTLRKEIAAHRYFVNKFYGTSTTYSKGYWPAECAFSERIIKALVDEGIQWSIIANSHLSRTLNDFPTGYGKNICNIDPPNKADKVETNGINWWNGEIDGLGGTLAAPYCYTPHKAKYVDPANGNEYKISVVPMCDVLSYIDGFQKMGTNDIDQKIAPYNNPARPSLVLLAHDGDNNYGGGNSYYNESVYSFVDDAAKKGYEPTTIQQYLNDHPVPDNDLVHVEDGAWVNAKADYGHPQFINWLWPLYNPTTLRFNPDGWTEDARNWAVITAIENYVTTAEDMVGPANVRIEKCSEPDATANDAEKAWHFYMATLNSGYMYYGKSLDMEVKQSLAGNHAIAFAQNEINKHPGVDNTAPSVFVPQRFPYNPGGKGFGPLFNYVEKTMPKEFDVWTYAFDVSGVQSAVLKYRTDVDGKNPLTSNQNETYVGGSEVGAWVSVTMTKKVLSTGNVPGDAEINFFILPTKIADLYYGEIAGITNKMVDYYVEAVDSKGNVTKTDIQHVWVSDGLVPVVPVASVTVSPTAPKLMPGTTKKLTATVYPADATNKTVTWSSNNPNVASVDQTGLVTAKILGTAVITVTTVDGLKTATSNITVTNDPVQSFTVYYLNSVPWGTPIKIHHWDAIPTGVVANTTWPGETMDQVGTTNWWKFTFTGIESTKLIFNGAGGQTPNLSRGSDGWYKNGQWYDTDPESQVNVTGVNIVQVSISIEKGLTSQLNATITPLEATNKNVTWVSDNTAVATVSSTGLVTAVGIGNCNITVKSVENPTIKDVCSVTVIKAPISQVTILTKPISIAKGATYQLTATVSPAHANQAVIWTTSDASKATVSPSGLVTAIDIGSANITATSVDDNTKKDVCVATIITSNITYYRIRNRWKPTTYIKDDGAGKVTYGISPVGTDIAYHWSQETAAGYILLKNRNTGKYMHNQNLYDYVETGTILPDWWSAMWTLENTGDGWIRIRNRYKTTDLVHIENLKGYAQRLGASNTWWSAMWQLETVSAAAKSLSISDNKQSLADVKIFPNPLTSKSLNVTISGFNENTGITMTITDFNGRTFYQKIIYNSGIINLDIPSGIYIVNIYSKDYKKINKLIVK